MSLIPSSPADTVSEQARSIKDDHSRNFSLDLLRGLALMGLLILSIREFGGFTTNQQHFFSPLIHGGNYKLMRSISILFEGKMTALLAMVFGAGLLLFMQKKEHPSPLSSPDVWIRHMIWLLVFGVFNAFVLLWPGDILFQLGVMGILLFAFWRIRSRAFLFAALLCTLVYCGKQYWNYMEDKEDYKKYSAVMEVEKKFKQDSTDRAIKVSLSIEKFIPVQININDSLAKKKDTLTKKQGEQKGKWEGMVKGLKYDSVAGAAENKAMRSSSYGKIWAHFMQRAQMRESSWLYQTGVWELGAMMFLGMFLLGIGFFNNRFTGSAYFLVAALTLLTGFLLSWYRIHFNNLKLYDYAQYISKQAVSPAQFVPAEIMLLATGYASLLMLMLRAKFLRWLWQAIAAAGKLALTGYITQTIICTFFFYGYGFGYFGRLTQLQLYFIGAEIWLVQIVFAVFWLRYYTMGPIEWLWRCMVYRKKLPWKISKNAIPEQNEN